MAEELENRKCVITGEIKPKNELLRFTVLDNGLLVPDFNKKLEGRGFYFSNSKRVISSIVGTNKVGKALHKSAKIEPNLPELIEKLLAAKGLETLNLARKSGNLVLSFEKIKEKILKNKVAFVIEATDVGADSKKKMSKLCENIEILNAYDSTIFNRAFDRENVVHLAVLKSNIEAMVYENLKRYVNYLNG